MPLIANMRFFLITLFLILGLMLHYKLGIDNAWYLYLTSFILLLTHFLFGTVWAAFSFLKKGKILEAENLINRIKRPEWLWKTHRAYYHFIKGMIAVQQKEMNSGCKSLKKALDIGLRTDNDSALAALRIAHASFMENNYQEANHFLSKAQSFNTDDLMIKDNLKELELALQKTFN